MQVWTLVIFLEKANKSHFLDAIFRDYRCQSLSSSTSPSRDPSALGVEAAPKPRFIQPTSPDLDPSFYVYSDRAATLARAACSFL